MIKLRSKSMRVSERRKGAMLILICVMMFAFVVTVAFAVDVAYMQLVRSELRSATDAASKAASEALARTQDLRQALDRGIEVGAENLVANKPLQLQDSDFEVGRSELGQSGKFVFSTTARPINSIRVTGKRTRNSLSSSVNLFFGGIFGVQDFQPSEVCASTFIQRDIVLVVDRSGSMNDFNKFNDLRSAVALFTALLDESPVDERVGLASYSTTATEDVEVSTDLSRINTALALMPVDGFTNISGGIDAGGNVMTRANSGLFVEKTMILLTDGLQNRGRPAVQAARVQADRGVVIHTITFGADADQQTMAAVARIGNGRTFHANNGSQLRDVFREIALTLTTIITQ